MSRIKQFRIIDRHFLKQAVIELDTPVFRQVLK